MADEAALNVQPLRNMAGIVGLVGAAFLGLGFLLQPAAAFRSYLWGFCVVLMFPLGGLAIVLLQHLTGGGWGVLIRRPLEAAMRTIVLVGVLFVPIIVGMKELYIWARPEVMAHDPVLQSKSWYLDPTFFLYRAAFYFTAWVGMVVVCHQWSKKQDQSNSEDSERRLRMFAAPALGLYMLTITFASIDWVMSLEPHWISSIFGVLFAIGQVLGAFAFGVLCVMILRREPAIQPILVRGHLRDFGSLMLAFTMFWAYLAISQFILTWSGNLQEEAPYYSVRLNGGWQYMALLIGLLQFMVPFIVLLGHDAKRKPEVLLKVASLVVFMRMVDLYWTIAPAVKLHGRSVFWTDLAVLPAFLGVWLYVFLGELQRMPLVPKYVSPEVEDDHHV